MFQVNQLIGFGAGGALPPSMSLIGSIYDGTRGTNVSATFSTPTTYTGRFFIATMSLLAAGVRNVTSVTIGGITANFVQTGAGVFGGSMACIAWAVVPTGTSTLVRANINGDESEGNIWLWEMTGHTSTTPVGSGADNSSPYSITLTGSTPGARLVGVVSDYFSHTINSYSPEFTDIYVAVTSSKYTLIGQTSQTNQTVSVDVTPGSFSYPTFAAAAWI